MIDDDYEIKFWTWGRKIDEQVINKIDDGEGFDEVREFLQKCADMREKYIDLSEITDTEEYYTEKIHDFFVDYNVNDPIYDYLFKK